MDSVIGKQERNNNCGNEQYFDSNVGNCVSCRECSKDTAESDYKSAKCSIVCPGKLKGNVRTSIVLLNVVSV